MDAPEEEREREEGGLDSARSTRVYIGRCLLVSDQLIFVASLSLSRLSYKGKL